jgi:hypothetical protein
LNGSPERSYPELKSAIAIITGAVHPKSPSSAALDRLRLESKPYATANATRGVMPKHIVQNDVPGSNYVDPGFKVALILGGRAASRESSMEWYGFRSLARESYPIRWYTLYDSKTWHAATTDTSVGVVINI